MASQIDWDLASIGDEDLLRTMWQQAEDFGRKKEIRSRMYKLRESKLRDFYSASDDMDQHFGSTARITPSHGDSLVDQSFQSFKAKEIRDSISPPHGGIIRPDTSGWNVVASSEVSPDGRAYKTESLATTGGVQKLAGGQTEYSGKNEHMAKGSHQGDEKNYLKTAAETSKTNLQEKTVVGDPNSGRYQQSSTSVQSFSNVSSSEQRFTSDGGNVPQFQGSGPSAGQQHRNSKDISQQHQQQQQLIQQSQNERYNSRASKQQHETIEEINKTHNLSRKLTQQEIQAAQSMPGKILSRNVEYSDPNTKVITEMKELTDGSIITTRRYEKQREGLAANQSATSQQTREQRQSSFSKHEVKSQRQEIHNVESSQRRESVQSVRGSDAVDRAGTTTHGQHLKDQVETFGVEANRTVKKDLSQNLRDQRMRNEDFIESERGCAAIDRHTSEKYTREFTGSQDHSRNGFSRKQTPEEPHFATHGYPSAREPENREMRQKSSKPDFTTQGFPSVKTDASPGFKRTVDVSSKSDYQTQEVSTSYTTQQQTSLKETSHKQKETDTTVYHGFPATKEPEKPRNIRNQNNAGFTTQGFPTTREPQKPGRQQKEPVTTTHGFPSQKEPQKPSPAGLTDHKYKVDQSSKIQSSVKHTTTESVSDVDVTLKTKNLTQGFPPVRTGETSPKQSSYPTQGFPSVRPTDTTPTKTGYQYKVEESSKSEIEMSSRKVSGGYLKKETDFSTQGFPSVRPKGTSPGQQQRQPSPGPLYKIAKSSASEVSENETIVQSSTVRSTKPSTQDYSTQGFPAVKEAERKPAGQARPQEPGTRGPVSNRTTTSQGFPSTREPEKPEKRPTESNYTAYNLSRKDYETSLATKEYSATQQQSTLRDTNDKETGYSTPRAFQRETPTEGHEPSGPDYSSPSHGFPATRGPEKPEKRPTESHYTAHNLTRKDYETSLATKEYSATQQQSTLRDTNDKETGYSTPRTFQRGTPPEGNEPSGPDYSSPSHGFPATRGPEKPEKRPTESHYTAHNLTRKDYETSLATKEYSATQQQSTLRDTNDKETGYSTPRTFQRGTPSEGHEPSGPDYSSPSHGFPATRGPEKPEKRPTESHYTAHNLTRKDYETSLATKEYSATQQQSTLRDTNDKETGYSTPRAFQRETPTEGHEPSGPDYSSPSHGFPATRGPEKPEKMPTESDYTAHNLSRKDYETSLATKEYSATQQQTNLRDFPSNEKEPDYTSSHGFPSAKPQTGSPGRPRENIEPKRHPDSEPGYTTHGFPSAKSPTDSPRQAGDDISYKRPTSESAFTTTHGFPSTRESPKKTAPEYTTHGFPSVKAPSPIKGPGRPEYIDDDASSITTERTDFRGSKESLYRTRVTLDVDASHERFARSLRCVSPVDQRRGSTKSVRTSTSSIRSTQTPERKSQRSPSHESETSKISSSTMTKSKNVDTSRKNATTRSSTIDHKSSKTDTTTRRNLHKSNEVFDFNRDERRKGTAPKPAEDTRDEPLATQKTLAKTERQLYTLKSVEEPIIVKKYIAPLCPGSSEENKIKSHSLAQHPSKTYPTPKIGKSPKVVPNLPSPLSKSPKETDLINPKHPIINNKIGGGKQILTKQYKLSEKVKTNRLTLTKMRPQAPRISSPRKSKPSPVRTLPHPSDDAHKCEEPRTSSVEIRNQRADRSTTDSTQREQKHKSTTQTKYDSTDHLTAENKPSTDPTPIKKQTAPKANDVDIIGEIETPSSDEEDSLEEYLKPSKKPTPHVRPLLKGNADEQSTIPEGSISETVCAVKIVSSEIAASSERALKTGEALSSISESPPSLPEKSQASKGTQLLEKAPNPTLNKGLRISKSSDPNRKPQTTLIKRGLPPSRNPDGNYVAKGNKVLHSTAASHPYLQRPKTDIEPTSVKPIPGKNERSKRVKPANVIREDEREELLTEEETDLPGVSYHSSPEAKSPSLAVEQLNHLPKPDIAVKKVHQPESKDYLYEETGKRVEPIKQVREKHEIFPKERVPSRSQKYLGKHSPAEAKPEYTGAPLIANKEAKEPKVVKSKPSSKRTLIQERATQHLAAKHSARKPQNSAAALTSQKPSRVEPATSRRIVSERVVTKHETALPILTEHEDRRVGASTQINHTTRSASQAPTDDDNLEKSGYKAPSANRLVSSPAHQQAVEERDPETLDPYHVEETTRPAMAVPKRVPSSHATQLNEVTVSPTANSIEEKIQIRKGEKSPRLADLEPEFEEGSSFLEKLDSSAIRAKPLGTTPILVKKIPFLSPVPQESGEEGELGLSETEEYFDKILTNKQTPKIMNSGSSRSESDSSNPDSDIPENTEDLEITATNLNRPQEAQTSWSPKSPKETYTTRKGESERGVDFREVQGSLLTSTDTYSIRVQDSVPTTFADEYFSDSEFQNLTRTISHPEREIRSSNSEELLKPVDVTSEEDGEKAEEILTRTSSALKQPLPTNQKTAKITKVDSKSVTRNTVQDQTIIPTEFIKGKPVPETKGTKPASKKPESVKTPTSKPSPDKYTSTSVTTRTTEDIKKQQDTLKTQTDTKKPKTIYGPKAKEMPEGHEPGKPHSPERGTPVHKRAPEVSRSPNSSPERSKRPGKPTESVEGTPKSPNKGDTKSTTYIETAETNEKFTKTQQIDHATLRDDKTPRSKRPQGIKSPTKDREGYQPESPRSRSPTGLTSDLKNKRLHQTTDLDTEDITIEVNLKNIRHDVDLVTTETDSRKQYVSEKIVTSEHDDTKKKVTTTANDANKYPTEPFYLREPKSSDTDEPQKPADIKKPKAPFNRSETYEERCRQILGMGSTTTTKEEPRRPKPAHDVQDFITSERITQETDEKTKFLTQTNITTTEEEDELIRKTQTTRRDIDNTEEAPSRSPTRRSKAPTRETSPKLENTRPTTLPYASVPSYRDALLGSPSSRSPEFSPTTKHQTTHHTTDQVSKLDERETFITTSHHEIGKSPESTLTGKTKSRSPASSPDRKPQPTRKSTTEITVTTAEEDVTSTSLKGRSPTGPSRQGLPTTEEPTRGGSKKQTKTTEITRDEYDVEITQKTQKSKTDQFTSESPISSPTSSLKKKPKQPKRSPEQSPTRLVQTTTNIDNEENLKVTDTEVTQKTVKGSRTPISPDHSPSRRPQSTTVTEYEVTQKAKEREVINKKIKGQAPTDSPRTQSPSSSLERKPKSTARSPDDSPTRRPQSKILVDYETSQKLVNVEVIDSTTTRQTTDSTTSSLGRKPKSTAQSPTRRTQTTATTETVENITDDVSIRRTSKGPVPTDSPTASLERKPKPYARSPETSPTRRTPITTTTDYETTQRLIDIESGRKSTKGPTRNDSPRTDSPTSSPERRQPHHTRYPEYSPTRTTQSSTVEHYENIESTHKTVESVSTELIHSRSPSTSPVRRPQAPSRTVEQSPKNDSPTTSPNRKQKQPTRSPDQSPSRRAPSAITKAKPTDSTGKPSQRPLHRSPDASPIRKTTTTVPDIKPKKGEPAPKTTKGKSPTSSPTRKPKGSAPLDTSPSRRHPDYETMVTSKDEKHLIKKVTEHEEHVSHVTTAKIHLSPTSTRKTGHPTRELESNVSKPTSRTVVREEPSKTSRPSATKSPTKPTTEKVITDRRRVQEDYTQESYRSSIDKQTTRKEVNETDLISKSVSTKRAPTAKKPITERKESAPVYGTKTTKDVSQKMTRSTSDNVIKTSTPRRVKPEIETTHVEPTKKSPRKTSTEKTPTKTEKRPSKHLATKTINLTATNTIINSEDMENVIIDIQQAKSSREPSPNKMIPVPVPNDEDTGKPRFPDKVQEPEEERRKSRVKNIPIFEEETNDFVGCSITEVEDVFEERQKKKIIKTQLVEDEETFVTTNRTTKTARGSSPYKGEPTQPMKYDEDDECLLSVHDKVNKFITTAEEVKKPKTSTPFHRDSKLRDGFTEEDDCLLSVNAKVSKFTSTAESITKPSHTSRPVDRPSTRKIDDNVKTDECVASVSEKVSKFINTAEKLTALSPQKSPELVAQIERQKPKSVENPDDDLYERRGSPTKTSYKPILKSSEAIKKAKSVFEAESTTSSVKTSTKQKDILSRPSVWEGRSAPLDDVGLQDIGVYKKRSTNQSQFVETVDHGRSPSPDEDNFLRKPKTTKDTKVSSFFSDSVSSKKDIFENKISTSRATSHTSKAVKGKPEPSPKRSGSKTSPDYSPTRRPDSTSENYLSTHSSSKRAAEYSSENKYSTTSTVRKESDKHISKTLNESPRSRPSEEPLTRAGKRPESQSPSKSRQSPTRDVESHYYEKYSSTSKVTSSKYPDDYSPTRRERSPTERYPGSESPRTPVNRHGYDGFATTYSKDYVEQHHGTASKSRITDDSVSAKRNIFEKPQRETPSRTSSDRGGKPSYMEHTVSSLEHRRDSTEQKSQHRRSSTDSLREVPSYMDHTISSLEHVNKSHYRKSSTDSVTNESRDGNPRSGTKFGVELKHVEGKFEGPRRKSSSSEIPHIEEIDDIELLEQMLHTVVGYEQRRRIRSQIREVKKILQSESKEFSHKSFLKHEHSSSRGSSPSPDRHTSPSRRINIRNDSSQFIESESTHITKHEEKYVKERSESPAGKVRTITTVTEVRKSADKPQKTVRQVREEVKEEKPIWATKNILKKASDNERTVKTGSIKKSVSSKTQTTQRQQVLTDEDCVTSSYGIGPTDEDGRPLFGIRALKKKSTQPSESTKVTGSVITESYYSENGAPPVGERKVYMYSTNPEEVEQLESKLDKSQRSETIKHERSSKGGLTSITRVDKIAKGGNIDEQDILAITDRPSTTPIDRAPAKIVRKGSVKEMTEKFIRRDSASSTSEKLSSSSYPKAGLILRTQTHASRTTASDDLDYDDPTEECDIQIKTPLRNQSRMPNESESDADCEDITSKSTKSFLNSSGSKVTGVSDILDRMRNADNVVEAGDTQSDKEARALLNKFLGATVLMSGMESMVPKEVTTTTCIVGSPSGHEVKTTRVKTTITREDSSAPVVQETCDIEDIWDEQVLKDLLQKSTTYEERRKIRSRLRQLMAEREACADVVASISAELQREGILEQQTKFQIDKVSSGSSFEEEEEDDNEAEEAREVEEIEEEDESSDTTEYEDIEEIVEKKEAPEEEEEETDEEEEEEEEEESTDEEAEEEEEVEVEAEEHIEKVDKTEKLSNITPVKDEELIEPKITTIAEQDLSTKEELTKSDTTDQEESLLLPLLQGLLHKNTVPQVRSHSASDINIIKLGNGSTRSVGTHNSTPIKITQPEVENSKKLSNMNNSTGHHVEDSGTESGEDLKLIAAGLRDSMQIHSMNGQGDSALISEVTTALNRLEQSLKEGNGLKLDVTKKNALLSLVDRLQTGLLSPEKITPPTPAPVQNSSVVSEVSFPLPDATKDPKPNHQRFAKRRNRANRHTVGVSKEELADARRYIEEMVMKEPISNSTTPESTAVTPPEFAIPLEKSKTTSQLATPETAGCSLYRPNKFVPKHLKDSSDMFSYAYNPPQDFKLEDPPIVHMREKKPKYQAMRQSANVETLSSSVADQTEQKRPYSECYSFDYSKNQPKLQNTQETIAESNSKDDIHFETEQDKAVYEKNLYNKTHHGGQPVWNQKFNGSRLNAFASENTESSIDAKLNRFSNKKLLMKRANTIDIPKPMRYMNDMETDSEAEERGINSTKSIGLRGTVQVSVKDKPKQVVPAFQPKTENDHKFLAFINKQSSSPGLGWKNSSKIQPTPVSNWSNKFGNIKNSFETGAIVTSNKPPVPVTSAARNFWKKSEINNATPQQQQPLQPLKQQQPKPQQQSNPYQQPKSQQQQFRIPSSPKANDKIVKPPWADKTYSSDVMNAALKTARLRDESPTSINYVPKPVPVNKFSHAPMSAFKPVETAATTQQQNQFKPIEVDSAQIHAAQTQPSPTKHWVLGNKFSQPNLATSGLPWASKAGSDSRVLNKVGSRFENKSPVNVNVQRQQSLGIHDQSYPQGPRIEQKRPSLPNTAQYNTEFNRTSLERTPQQSENFSSGGSGPLTFTPPNSAKEFPPLPYICTDYTQPGNVSTYIPENPLARNDSLTNPNAEPLILTSDRPIISPNIAAQQQPLKIFDFPSSPESTPTTPNHTYQDLSDDEEETTGVKEYKAESKVMRGPVSQQAVTVSNRTNRIGDDEEYGKHSQAAKQLLSVMKNIGNSKSPERKPATTQIKYNSNETKHTSTGSNSSAQDCISPDGTNYHAPIVEPIFPVLNANGNNRMPVYNGTKKENYQENNSSFNGSYQNSKSSSYSSVGLKSQSSTPMTPQTPDTPQSYKGQYQQNPLYIPPASESQKKNSGSYPMQSNQYESSYNQEYPQPSFQEAYKSPNYQPPVYDYQQSEDKVVQQLRQQQSLQEAVKTQSTQNNHQKQNRDSYDEREKFYQQQIQEINRLQQKQREANEISQKSKQKYFEDSQKLKSQSILQHQSSQEESYKEQRYAYQQESEQLKVKAKATKQLQKDKSSADQTEVSKKKALCYEETKNSVGSAKSLKTQSESTKTTFNMPAYQKNLTNAEAKTLISSQPADTPDIVKSSLPKEDIPILKKFGPSRPHLYHPNAYQGAVIKTDTTVHSKALTVSSVRKYSEPTVSTKFVAPKIIETPSSPLPAGKGEIPAHIVFNNVAQFSGMGRRSIDSSRDNSPASKYRPNPLSKSDSWHQIVQQQNATVKPPSPKGFNNTEFNPLRRAKSGHTLAVPMMYEAAMDKSEVIEKQKIVAAYFSGQKSPNSLSRNSSQSNIPEAIEASISTSTTKKSSINRIKSSEKASVSNPNPSTGIVRSQTVPHMVNLNLLDESNVDDAFEQLLNAS